MLTKQHTNSYTERSLSKLHDSMFWIETHLLGARETSLRYNKAPVYAYVVPPLAQAIKDAIKVTNKQ